MVVGPRRSYYGVTKPGGRGTRGVWAVEPRRRAQSVLSILLRSVVDH